jgi:hypothetical protein
MESWLREESSKVEAFKDDYTTFRKERDTRDNGVFNSVKICIACVELWADEDLKMIAVKVKVKDAKITWEILGITGFRMRTCEL